MLPVEESSLFAFVGAEIKLPTLPEKTKKIRTYRTHKDAFADIWSEIEAKLEENPSLQSQEIMQWLIEVDKDKYSWSKLRTLQRRIREWRLRKRHFAADA